MRRRLTALALAGVIALAAAGCGSSSSSSTSTAATASPATTATQGSASTPSTTTQSGGATTPTQTTTGGGGSSSSGSSETPESSIENYGTAASSALKGTLAATAFSFFKAMATSDYAKICAGLSASNVQELQAFLRAKHQNEGGCVRVLRTVVPRVSAEARKAAAGTLTSVRVKGDTAFVIFKPKGGKASYFVLKREGSAWKAISLAPGTPLNPVAG